MSNAATNEATAAARTAFFDALADTRRRTVLRAVHRRSPDGIGSDELVHCLTAATTVSQSAAVSDDARRRTLVDLRHRLLPALIDVGLLERADDGTIALGAHPAVADPRLEGVLSTRYDADDATLDAVFRGLADERRRTILSILAAEERPLETDRLVRRVAAREGTPVEMVETAFVHVHGPLLADASLIDYDPGAERVADAGHSVVDLEWLESRDATAAAKRRVDDAMASTHQLVYRAQPRSP